MGEKARGAARRGSTTSDREIAFAVRTGQQVTFHPAVGDPVTGYVCGMDDFHWKVIVPSNHNSIELIHKTAPRVQVHPEPTYDQDKTEAIEKIVAPFRSWVMKEFFQQGEEPSPRHLSSASTGEVKTA